MTAAARRPDANSPNPLKASAARARLTEADDDHAAADAAADRARRASAIRASCEAPLHPPGRDDRS